MGADFLVVSSHDGVSLFDVQGRLQHKILTKVNHPYVVACYEAFETDDRMYLFLELMTGGELFDRIVDQGHFTEDQAKEATYKLLSALDYMHKQGVCHRDLRLANIMLRAQTESSSQCCVKLIDGGNMGPADKLLTRRIHVVPADPPLTA